MQQRITFRAGKTDQLLTIPMHPELYAYFLERPASDNGKAFLFPSLAGKSSGGKSGLSMVFSRIMGAAKVRGEVAREERAGDGDESIDAGIIRFQPFRGIYTALRQRVAGTAYWN